MRRVSAGPSRAKAACALCAAALAIGAFEPALATPALAAPALAAPALAAPALAASALATPALATPALAAPALAASALAASATAARGTATTPAAPGSPPAAGQPVMGQPVIIDTDVGDDIDDAFALAIALQDPRLEVIGITTAWGDTRTRTLLVRRLLTTLGRQNVVVAQGPATPSKTPFTQRKWAMGALDTSAAPDAVEFIRDQVRKRPGEITLIALAPLTNIEALQRRDPDAIHKLKQVALMGGSIYAGYNLGGALPVAQPSAEYNVVSAPQGLRILLESRIPVKMFPLDSTQIKFDEVRRDRLFAYGSPASDALTLLYHQWRLYNGWSITPTLFDAVPVTSLLQPSTCPVTPMRITVDEHGYTRPVPGEANAAVCLTVDENATQRLIMDTLAPLPHDGAP